jgi:hypothetical protein
VVDNDSTDGSLRQLLTWRDTRAMREMPHQLLGPALTDYEWTEQRGLQPKAGSSLRHASFIVVENEQNLGFAAGCNVGIRLALALNMDFIWLLNNDTYAQRDCLQKQLELLQSQPAIDCVVPAILVADSGEKVWNCGGRLLPAGLRRYFYAGMQRRELPQSGWRRVSFVTGCSLLLRRSLVLTAGLLSEDFFFGEEDVEFSMRMRRLGKRAACCFDAILVHRVSSTFAGSASRSRLLGRVYLYYLNRFVHFRRYLARPLWRVWCALYMGYVITLLLRRYTRSPRVIRDFVARLYAESATADRVTREMFFAAIRRDFFVPQPVQGESP